MRLTRAVTVLCFIMSSFVIVSQIARGSRGADRSSPADARQQVLDLGKRWAEAENKHDEATLRRILDEKFVVSFGAKPPYDKETFIRHEVSGEVDPTVSQTLTDETVVIDQDTAVVVGTDTMQGTKDGVAYRIVGRYTATYIYRQGQWVALAEHLVKAQ